MLQLRLGSSFCRRTSEEEEIAKIVCPMSISAAIELLMAFVYNVPTSTSCLYFYSLIVYRVSSINCVHE